MKVSSYGVVKEMNLEALIRSVNANIELGIQPIGGLVINTTYHGVEYLQAMVNPKEEGLTLIETKVESQVDEINSGTPKKKLGRPFGTIRKGVTGATAS